MSPAAGPLADGVCFRQNGFVRDVPGVAGSVLGVMKRGEVLPRASQPSRDGWLAVVYRGDRAWVAERFVDLKGDGMAQKRLVMGRRFEI